MALMSETELANSNLTSKTELIARMSSIEAQTIAWMAKATALYGTVDAGDQPVVIALRNELKSKLTAAVAV